ncbi:tRNA pseudouridine(55) synthase TruB [Oceanobacillus arenosus]|uniref:tRNA pseudouridine synthase B n=1 Tax=Oceanobacillus arenosus TaxID=1229153 RepID=A0A3D8PTS2_9BACI|nr:tRNA pseudouridine(55) synthase TruB [Oceanobacillus arenosus]RDW19523.1 tRNA pseudouridine(55) synthase TruB [Oceanobacillus arenosus]
MNGILPLWKPKGMTSHDCVMKCRRLFKTRKVGHTGTLDPEVEGVLPICIGEATKIVPFLTDTKKTYIAEVKLGTATDTEDAQGKVVEAKKVVTPIAENTINEVLESFMGTITQIPPMYSAVKVNGRKLYEYARANETVERPKREITIYDIQLLSLDTDSFKIKVLCSKGTYIRTLCVDIGKKLGYPAHMSALVRTNTGSFSEKNTVTFANIEEAAEINEQERLLVPIIHGVDHLAILDVDEVTTSKVMNGQKLPKPQQTIETDPFLVMHEQQLLAIYQNHPDHPDQIKPVRVFNG